MPSREYPGRPAGDQHVPERGDEQPDDRDPALAQPGNQRAAEHSTDRERDEEAREQQRAAECVLAEQRLRDQLDVDERHHQRGAGAEARAQRGQERHHPHAGRVEQLGPGSPLPQPERQEHPGRRGERGRAPWRQHRVLRVGVVQPDDEQAEPGGEQDPADHVDTLPRPPGRTIRVPGEGEEDRGCRQYSQGNVDPEDPSPPDERGDYGAVQGA